MKDCYYPFVRIQGCTYSATEGIVRIGIRIKSQLHDALSNERIENRLRLAFGSYASEVSTVVVVFDEDDGGVAVDVCVRLRDRRVIRVSTSARDFGLALAFIARRAVAAVARRCELDRILGHGS